MTNITAISLLGLMAIAVPAAAWDEPDAFRGLAWEASEQQFREKHPDASCADSTNRALADRMCLVKLTIGDVPVSTFYTFRGDKFVQVRLRFKPENFNKLALIFAERYGFPMQKEDEELKTRGGLTYTNSRHEWEGPKVFITLTRYQSAITEGVAMIGLKADREEGIRRLREQRKKAAGDL